MRGQIFRCIPRGNSSPVCPYFFFPFLFSFLPLPLLLLLSTSGTQEPDFVKNFTRAGQLGEDVRSPRGRGNTHSPTAPGPIYLDAPSFFFFPRSHKVPGFAGSNVHLGTGKRRTGEYEMHVGFSLTVVRNLDPAGLLKGIEIKGTIGCRFLHISPTSFFKYLPKAV